MDKDMRLKTDSKDAQFFSLDMLIGIFSLIIIIIASIWVWDSTRETIASREQRGDLEFVSRNAFAAFIETSGYPSDWYTYTGAQFYRGNIFAVGLSEYKDPLVLDQKKIDALKVADWDNAKRMMGYLGAGYDLNINIYVWNGTGFGYNDTIGPSIAKPSEIVKVTRFGLLDNKWTMLELTAWKE